MEEFIARQPNGLYCRFSTTLDTVTHYNMSTEKVIEYYLKEAEEKAKDILQNQVRPFSEVIENFIPNNMAEKEFEEIVKEMNKTPLQILAERKKKQCCLTCKKLIVKPTEAENRYICGNNGKIILERFLDCENIIGCAWERRERENR